MTIMIIQVPGMAKRIDFYFDFGSPYSYLASTQLPALADGASIAHKPFRILELMKMVGNRPTTLECKVKGRYAGIDLGRWAARYGVKLQRNPHMRGFDFDALRRGALVAIDEGRAGAYVDALYRAVWASELNLAEATVLNGVLEDAGFDGAALMARAAEPACVARLDKETEAAAERGVFGAPTFFVGDEMFFGNDRLDFVAGALKQAV
jgi:2-hydroxychromene-2-carboxylate isomerase